MKTTQKSTGLEERLLVHRKGVVSDITTRSGMIKAGLQLIFMSVWWHKFNLHITGLVGSRTKKILQTPVDEVV